MPTSIPRLCRSIPSVYLPTKLENTSPSAQASVAGVRFAMGPPCQLRFRGSAAPSQSRAFASRWGRRANFDSAALPLHLSRGRSPYGKIETGPGKNVNTLPEPCFYFPARLIAVTKALTSLYITDNKFLLILTDPHGFLSR